MDFIIAAHTSLSQMVKLREGSDNQEPEEESRRSYLALMMYCLTLQKQSIKLLIGRKIRMANPMMKTNLRSRQQENFQAKDIKQKIRWKTILTELIEQEMLHLCLKDNHITRHSNILLQSLGDHSYKVVTPFGKQRRNHQLLAPWCLEGKPNVSYPRENILIPEDIAKPNESTALKSTRNWRQSPEHLFSHWLQKDASSLHQM